MNTYGGISNVTAEEMKESMAISLRAAREMAKAGMNLVVLREC
jgi:hypothetical protein